MIAAKTCRHAATKRTGIRKILQIFKGDLARWIYPQTKLFTIVLSILTSTWGTQAENLLQELRRKARFIEGRRMDGEFETFCDSSKCNSKARCLEKSV